ncbi:MAG: AAA family ATPase [Chthonomonadales bacterium]|nr:AAA family ATPase [Chthonomonadales bacterium]
MGALVALTDAAVLARVSPQTIRNYIRDGRLKSATRTPTGRYMVDREEVLAVFRPVRQPRIIVVANQKGGVGKTTTVQELGVLLGRDVRTLLIDVDPQANLTKLFGIDREEPGALSIADVMLRRKALREVWVKIEPPANLWLVPSCLALGLVPMHLGQQFGADFILRDAVQKVRDDFEFILIDTPPSLDRLTLNALGCANEVIIPIDKGPLGIRGTENMETILEQVRDYNKDLRAVRVLHTKSDNTVASNTTRDLLERRFGPNLLRTAIRSGTKVAEAAYQAEPLQHVFPESHPARDYQELAREVLSLGA